MTTIRADREAYYCGVDDLFETHPGVIENISLFDSSALVILFDGLVWVSRNNEKGQRRVNYYVKHLYGNPEMPRFKSPYRTPLNFLTKLTSVTIFTHPVTQFMINLKWKQFAKGAYIAAVMPFIAMMILFVLGYIVFEPQTEADKMDEGLQSAAKGFRIALLLLNIFVLGCLQLPRLYREVKKNQIGEMHLFGKCTLRLPFFLFKASNVCKFFINVALVNAFFTDDLLGFGKWIGDGLVTKRVHSWMVCSCSVLFFTQFLDLYALQIDMAKFKLQLVLESTLS